MDFLALSLISLCLVKVFMTAKDVNRTIATLCNSSDRYTVSTVDTACVKAYSVKCYCPVCQRLIHVLETSLCGQSSNLFRLV